jgi:hypothetical protein
MWETRSPFRSPQSPRGCTAAQNQHPSASVQEAFQSFADQYEAKHAIIYGRFRIKRITEVVEKFIFGGDYS